MNLGIGTVQFGLDYGISNREGQTPLSEVKDILSFAAAQGLTFIDTASQYGNSEEIIGVCLPNNHSFQIVSKTPSFKKALLTSDDALFLKETFYTSLRKLRQKSVYGILIHHADNLLSENGEVLWRAMQDLKDAGVVEKIGVSVYSPDQIDAVLHSFHIDLVQLPVNVFDQRMIRSGNIRKLKDMGIEIHSRSVFLQGILLMDPTELPASFRSVRDHLMQYHQSLARFNISPVKAALHFVSEIEGIDATIVGINNLLHLKDIFSAMDDIYGISNIDFSDYAIDDPRIVDPSSWSHQ